MILELQFLKISVTSITSSFEILFTFNELIFSEIIFNPSSLFASNSIIFSSWSSCCTPFTSTIPLPEIEMFTSCRIEPIPLFTFFVVLSNLPNVKAISLTIDGSITSTGSKAIST